MPGATGAASDSPPELPGAAGMARAYGGTVVGGGAARAGTGRARPTRGHPNWWVVLAVSLALIAVLVVTAGTTPKPLRARTLGGHAAADARGRAPSPRAAARADAATTTSTSAPAVAPPTGATPTTSLLSAPSATAAGAPAAPAGGAGVTTTTTSAPAPTTTTAPSPGTTQLPATRSTQNEGYLDPPLQASQVFAFTGSGATGVSVVWSGSTYLTMVVSCPNGSQSVGGTSAMQATLPDAEGSCRATVSEPASESAALTFTITIGPAGG